MTTAETLYFTMTSAIGLSLSPVLAACGLLLGVIATNKKRLFIAAAVIGCLYGVVWTWLSWAELPSGFIGPQFIGIYSGAILACLLWVGLGRVIRTIALWLRQPDSL